MRTLFNRSILVLGAVCIAVFHAVAQEEPLTLRFDHEKDHKKELFPDRVIALDNDQLMAFGSRGRLEPSFGKVNMSFAYALTVYDRNTLAPIVSKELELQAPSGQAAMEDIFLHNGRPVALVSHQDDAVGKASVSLLNIDAATLALSGATELFSATDLKISKGTGVHAPPLGLKVHPDASSGGFAIVCEPVIVLHPQVSVANVSTFLCAALDKDLRVLWSGRPAEDLHLASFSFAVIPIGTSGVIFAGPRQREKEEGKEGSAEVVAYHFDGKVLTPLEAKGVGSEAGPHDIRYALRPDGKITVAGVYGKVRSSFTMSERRTDGLYMGVIDPTARSWTAFGTSPMLNEKGKPLYDLSLKGLESLPDNSARGLACIEAAGELKDIYLLGVDAGGSQTFNKRVSYLSIQNVTLYKVYDPTLVTHDDRCYVLLNDLPENEGRRSAGKDASSTGYKGVPCVMEVMSDGSYKQYFPKASSDPEQLIRPGRTFRIDANTWATGAGLGAGYSYFGLGLVTVK